MRRVVPWSNQPQGAADLGDIGRLFSQVFMPGYGTQAVTGNATLSANSAARGVGIAGLGADYTASSTISSSLPVSASYPQVIAWSGRFLGSSTNYHVVGIPGNGAGNGNEFNIRLNTGTTIQGRNGNNFTGPATVAMTPTLTGGASSLVDVDLVIVWQSLSATDHRLYCQGQMATSATNAGAVASNKTVFNVSYSVSSANHRTYWAAAGNRALTDSQALLLSMGGEEQWSLLFEPQRIWVPVSTASSGSSGTSATTNADDTSSASGTTTVIGSSAKTNANDTSSASGTTTVTGTSAKTNADDTSSASGAVGSNVTGTSATTNAADTSAASGTTTVVGTSSKTNGNDTASANGTTTVVGTSAQTNANDTATASGAAGAIVGTAAVTNANDYASANGVAVGSASNAAGRPTRRRYVVEIDGQDFIVESPDQARQLLDKATEAAEEKAEQALDRANKAQKRPQRKVMADARKALREPAIYAPEFPELAADVQRQIRAIYDSALQAIEISALLRKREEDEMDDEDIFLLL